MSKPEWYNSWFESPWYMRLYRHRTDEEAREAISIVSDLVGTPPGARVLDLCCGYGRHAMALAEGGYQVTGLDNSVYLIDRAREVYPHENVEYIVGDMRGPFPGAPYHTIANFFTSFGYFDSHTENLRVLEAVRSALVDSGTFVLDFLNATRLRHTLEPETITMFDGVTVVQERWIDNPFVHKRITITNPCSYELEYDERVWLYDRQELEALFREAGITPKATFGNYDGSAFNATESPRCILVGTAT